MREKKFICIKTFKSKLFYLKYSDTYLLKRENTIWRQSIMEKKFRRKIVVIGAFFLFLGASATLGVSARAWADNFDSYTNGQFLDGGTDDGGWKGWDNAPTAGAYVTNSQSYSSPNSVDINGATDLVHEYEGYTTGQWIYRCMQYVPNRLHRDLHHFILLSDYTDGAGQNQQMGIGNTI